MKSCSATPKTVGQLVMQTFHYAPQPNCQFNANATKGHAFIIFMALGCALRPAGLRRRLPWWLGLFQIKI